MTSEEKLTWIERYFMKNLSQTERQKFEKQLDSDPLFNEEVLAFQNVLEEINRYGNWSVVQKVGSWEKEFQEKEQLYSGMEQNENEQTLYSLEEILDMFAPNPIYEKVMVLQTRGNNSSIICPENALELSSKDVLSFVLQDGQNANLKINIEDNKQNILYSKLFNTSSKNIQLNINSLSLKAGRYYWKLMGNFGMIVRSFFINKQIMNGMKF